MDKFTPRAQQVLALARKEADRFNHIFVDTEHLLLGLIKLAQGVAVNVLLKMGLDPNEEMAQILVGVGSLPFSSKQEEEADREGARLMHAVGYSVFQSVQMWEDVAERTGSGSLADEVEVPEGLAGELLKVGLGELENVLSTHPNSAQRACLLKQRAHALYQEQPLQSAYVGQTNWKDLKPLSEAEY